MQPKICRPHLHKQKDYKTSYYVCGNKYRTRTCDNKNINADNAILSGINIPELEAEIDNLRTRKSELEDLITYKETNKPNLSKEDIIKLFKHSAAHIDDANLKTVIQNHVTKITAHTDGSITVHIGVHLDSCGGRI